MGNSPKTNNKLELKTEKQKNKKKLEGLQYQFCKREIAPGRSTIRSPVYDHLSLVHTFFRLMHTPELLAARRNRRRTNTWKSLAVFVYEALRI